MLDEQLRRSSESASRQTDSVKSILGKFTSPPRLTAPEDTNLLASEQASTLAQTASTLAQTASTLATSASKSEIASKSDTQFASKLASEQASKLAKVAGYGSKAWTAKQQWNHRIEDQLYEALVELASLLGVKLSELNQMALTDIVRKYMGYEFASKLASEQASKLASEQSSGLIIKELSKLELLNYYSLITGQRRKISHRDRRMFDEAYAAYHPLLFELGLRASRHDGREVYSFKFCATAMSFRATWPLESVVEELVTLRERDAEADALA